LFTSVVGVGLVRYTWFIGTERVFGLIAVAVAVGSMEEDES
jgi:hypothetical protein